MSANLIRLLRIWWIEHHNNYIHCNLGVLRHLLKLIFLWEKKASNKDTAYGQIGNKCIKESDSATLSVFVCFLSHCLSICPCLACTHTVLPLVSLSQNFVAFQPHWWHDSEDGLMTFFWLSRKGLDRGWIAMKFFHSRLMTMVIPRLSLFTANKHMLTCMLN